MNSSPRPPLISRDEVAIALGAFLMGIGAFLMGIGVGLLLSLLCRN